MSAARALSAVLGLLTLLLIAYLGRAVWDARVGLVAAGIGAVFLPLIDLNASLLSESLFLVLGLLLALILVRVRSGGGVMRWAALAGGLCAAGALTRTVGILWLISALGVTCSAPRPRALPTAVAVAAFVAVLLPWTIRNADALHSFVPLSTQTGFTLAGQYNRDAGRNDSFEAVWRIPVQVAGLRPTVLRLYRRTHGSFNEAQLDGALLRAGLGYMERHPSHVLFAVGLDSLRMVDLGVNHGFTTSTGYREMGVPRALWTATTVSAWLLILVVVLAVLARVAGRLRFALGPWWLWAIGALPVIGAVPFVGGPRYLAPAYPLLLLVAAAAITAVVSGRPAPAPHETSPVAAKQRAAHVRSAD